MGRNIVSVIRQIQALIPDNYARKARVLEGFQRVIDEVPYRAPESICVSWEQLCDIIKAEFYKDACESLEWTWKDDIFEVLSDGNWSKTVSKIVK